ncbi:hypothetical protein KJ980_06740 [Patescibacteria group bacterium]|nr:hypothetical protein [Patescibacteria group bacterium]MBU4016267.1 hypothetical protein [Patescibacteria group bacterium]MBU4099317.1 hypothetical protein [Patescibacteria group bacterium]
MISQVRDKVRKFLKETLEAEGEVRVVEIDKTNDGWEAIAEVAEINQYLATIKPEYRVFEKRLYTVKLNSDLEVSSYRQGGGGEKAREE